MSPSVIVTLSVVLGIILSIAMYMWVFPIISKSILINNLPFYFKGVPMIVGGWLGFAFVFAKLGCQEFPTFILSIIMFVLGNVAVFGITWMIITMFRMAVSIVWAILPSVIMIAAIIYLVKRVLH